MKISRYCLTAILLAMALAGCQDLSVENPNNPDRARALAEPQDVQAIVGNLFQEYWLATQGCDGSMMLSTMADEHSSSWANWGMRDMSSEPRIAWDNSSSYSRRASTEGPWFNNYTGISNALDALKSINENEERFINEGIDVNKLRAFIRFNLGLMHGHLALFFDKAFVVDENVDLEAVAAGNRAARAAPLQPGDGAGHSVPR
ncbi:MAG: hypothetical protein KatS3mg042_1793 [Rhodothermaceae bacterium]|nr:MAG: hypothetical protein KatS3mg042_1793 [Rhodothermaceae bacterium]